tara:strand:- start:496 stop:1107 length:612 start_codon:yes stop_codon:yes gene_type:complete
MQVKDMFLKNEVFYYCIFVVIFFIFSHKGYSNTEDKIKILNHLNSLKNFSASFLQNDGESLSEGRVYIGEKRVRAEYFTPSKILIILDEDKAMYYNYELDEDEFFNPKKTNAWFFYDVFRNPFFFEDSLIEVINNEVIIEKKGFNNADENFLIRVYLENNPLVLRGIEVFIKGDGLKLSIYNHSYNEEYDKDFFKLINPMLLN